MRPCRCICSVVGKLTHDKVSGRCLYFGALALQSWKSERWLVGLLACDGFRYMRCWKANCFDRREWMLVLHAGGGVLV